MASSEDIEGRLCAYIEGDLDAVQRAEIERHLEAHPQHRQMIQDLIRTRNLLAALPPVPAPADLGEGLQGQLERSMLLGDRDDDGNPWRAKARRAPQILAMAAILAVAIGLGSVIYSLLRAGSPPQHIAPMSDQMAFNNDVPLAIAPVTQPATAPVLAVALLPATEPTTQPDGAVQLAASATQPSTEPVIEAALDPATQPATEPSIEPIEANVDFTLRVAPTTQPAPTTAPVADEDDDQ